MLIDGHNGIIAGHGRVLAARKLAMAQVRTKNNLEHIVPMADAVKIIINSRNRIADRDLVFGFGKGGFSGWSNAKKKLDGRLLERIPVMFERSRRDERSFCILVR